MKLNFLSATLGQSATATNAVAASRCTTFRPMTCSIPNKVRATAAIVPRRRLARRCSTAATDPACALHCRKSSKYRFIIEAIEREPADARMLEIGSSRGHLSSYFILSGQRITGVDVSTKAVAAARAAFGDHFVRAGDAAIEAQAPVRCHLSRRHYRMCGRSGRHDDALVGSAQAGRPATVQCAEPGWFDLTASVVV